MSGPKLIELRRMRAARERQRDHDRCAGFASEYARLVEEFNEWAKRLAQLCVEEKESVRPLETVREEAGALLAQGSHHEAARLFGEEVLRVRGLVNHRREQFQELLINLHNRHQQLVRDCETIAAERTRLAEQLKAAVPPSWPEADKLQNLAERALQKCVAPTSPALPGDPDGIKSFESAEQEAATALAGLRSAQIELEQELNATHARLLDASLGPAESTSSQSLAELLQRFSGAAKPTPMPDKGSAEIDRLLAELAAMSESDEFFRQARQKADDLRLESDPARRRMLRESLLIDGAARLKELRELVRWREEVQLLIDSAAHVSDPSVTEVVSELRLLSTAGRVADLEPVRQRLQAAITSAEDRREREYKRRALIDALKSLGYETNEGLETAFVKDGRLVLRRAGEDEYAVEMVANPELTQLQTALVRFADNTDLTEQQRRRDLEREERWCADHAQLRQQMAERGLETPFKMQLKSGEHPVRVVLDADRMAAARSRAAQATGNKRLKSQP